MNSQDSMLPTFAISDHTKGLMAWLAVDASASLDQVVAILTELYRMQRLDDLTFQDLLAVVRLREACETAEISVSDLRTAVELNVGLQERGLTVLDDIPTTLQVADELAEAGLSLKDAVAVASLIKAMKKAGVDPRVPEELQGALEHYGALGYEPKQITQLAELWSRLTELGLGLDDLQPVLAQLSRLAGLGLDGSTAEALATTLDLGRVPETQRGAVLTKAVELSQAGIALAEVEADRDALQEEIQQLRDEQGALQDALAAGQDELARIQQEQDQARAELAALREQATLLENAIPAGRALQGFLLGELDAADEFYDRVAVIRDIRRKRSPQFPDLETWLTAKIQERVREFLTQISTRPLPPAPGSQGTSAKG